MTDTEAKGGILKTLEALEDSESICIVFDGPPSHESGRFVEVETNDGRSISVGAWVERKDGLWSLRISPMAIRRAIRDQKMTDDLAALREQIGSHERLGEVAPAALQEIADGIDAGDLRERAEKSAERRYGTGAGSFLLFSAWRDAHVAGAREEAAINAAEINALRQEVEALRETALAYGDHTGCRLRSPMGSYAGEDEKYCDCGWTAVRRAIEAKSHGEPSEPGGAG